MGCSVLAVDVVLPCRNEAQSVERMTDLLFGVAHDLNCALRVTFVDDGSTDDTWPLITSQVDKSYDFAPNSFSVRGIRLSRPSGKAAAQAVGLSHSLTADFVVLMDSDGQHPSSSIPKMLEVASSQNCLVVGSRFGYVRGPISRVGVEGLRVMMRSLGMQFNPNLSEFLVMPRDVASDLVRSPRLGVVPIVQLLLTRVGTFEAYPVEIRPRIGSEGGTRWRFIDLWRKALLQLLTDPWSLLPRITLLASIAFLGLFVAGIVSGVYAWVQGTSPGTVAILGSVVVLAAISVATWISSIVVGVMTLRLIENLGRSDTEAFVVDSPYA